MIKLFAVNDKYSNLNIGTLPQINPDIPVDFFAAPVAVTCIINGAKQYLHIDDSMAVLSKDWKPQLTTKYYEQDLSKYDARYLYLALHRVCSWVCGNLTLTNRSKGVQAAVTLDCWLGS